MKGLCAPSLCIQHHTCSFHKIQRVFKAALIQMKVEEDVGRNLRRAATLIEQAKSLETSTNLICLPECFNIPCSCGLKSFEKYAELLPKGPTAEMLKKAAKENSVYIVAGTIPEVEDGLLFNTCSVWDPQGDMLAKYRKLHLLDIDIPKGLACHESDTLTPGTTPVMFDFEGVKVGLGICYDLRFEELAKLYRINGCELLIYPATFNMTTGPLHWELLQRGRAVDNQLFVFGISPARCDKGYAAWGHSQVTNPWGKIVAQAGVNEQILHCDVDLSECDKVRGQIPIFSQRRTDVYNTVYNCKHLRAHTGIV